MKTVCFPDDLRLAYNVFSATVSVSWINAKHPVLFLLPTAVPIQYFSMNNGVICTPVV